MEDTVCKWASYCLNQSNHSQPCGLMCIQICEPISAQVTICKHHMTKFVYFINIIIYDHSMHWRSPPVDWSVLCVTVVQSWLFYTKFVMSWQNAYIMFSIFSQQYGMTVYKGDYPPQNSNSELRNLLCTLRIYVEMLNKVKDLS